MGKIIVYTGPMFSQKTAFLLAEYDCSVVAQRTRMAFKPAIDGRFGKDVIKSRRGGTIDAICISDLSELLEYDVQDYFIDEFQFLTGDIQVLQKMAQKANHLLLCKNYCASRMKYKSERQFAMTVKQELLHILFSWVPKHRMFSWVTKSISLFAELTGLREWQRKKRSSCY